MAREAGVLSGGVLIAPVYDALCHRNNVAGDRVSVDVHINDSSPLQPGDHVATVKGPVQLLLTGERVPCHAVVATRSDYEDVGGSGGEGWRQDGIWL